MAHWERETIINFCESEKECDIYTHSEKWINRMTKLGFEPYAINSFGGRSYTIPKTMLKMPTAKRAFSEEQKKAASERFIKMHANKKHPINDKG